MKGYKLWDSENKKIVLNRYVTFDEASLLKSTISQRVERMKTKDISQRVEVDATPPSPVGSVSANISPNVTPGGDHVAGLDAEQAEEDVELFEGIETKMNPQKWGVNKREYQVGELDKFKLKINVLHGNRDEEAHMTQPVGFIAVESTSVNLVSVDG